MHPINSFKKFVLNLFLPYIEGTKKKRIKNESPKYSNYY